MLTPKELYYQYTLSPCEAGSFNIKGDPEGDIGAGTPYDLLGLSNFLKQLKYPCYSQAPFTSIEQSNSLPSGVSGILNTGAGKLALPFKFLQRLDVEAFTEIQPDIRSGTSHAIRNACDIMRACRVEASGNQLSWEHRGATEYIQHFGGNRIINCLMMLGPDLVSEEDAINRGTGCGPLSCLPKYSSKKSGSALGADFQCKPKEDGGAGYECNPCGTCDTPPEEIDPADENCCTADSCEKNMNWCCGDITGQREGIWTITDSTSTKTPQEKLLKHTGLLKRKSYGGYANFLNNSGSNFYACPDDLFIKYFQSINNYDYSNNTYKTSNGDTIDRARTISIVQPSTIDGSATVQSIKDLIYNGYGVVLMTNVGFPHLRDSTGLSYPDRIWYHTYAIIGYDDRKVEYNECVFLLANSWGKWNSGGHPAWGPIPDGSFLITETHLKCIVKLYRTDQKGCQASVKTVVNGEVIPGVTITTDACVDDSSCTPWECTSRQKAMGMVFALSMNDGFPRQILDHTQFYKVRESTYESNLQLYLNATG